MSFFDWLAPSVQMKNYLILSGSMLIGRSVVHTVQTFQFIQDSPFAPWRNSLKIDGYSDLNEYFLWLSDFPFGEDGETTVYITVVKRWWSPKMTAVVYHRPSDFTVTVPLWLMREFCRIKEASLVRFERGHFDRLTEHTSKRQRIKFPWKTEGF